MKIKRLKSALLLGMGMTALALSSQSFAAEGPCYSSRGDGGRALKNPDEIKKLCAGDTIERSLDDAKMLTLNGADNEQKPPYWWSTQYEQLGSCGFHPQRKELNCNVRLKRARGYFGVPPYNSPPSSTNHGQGTQEHVQFCVKYDKQPWQYVAASSVHVHDLHRAHRKEEASKPPWDYSVTIQADNDFHIPNTSSAPYGSGYGADRSPLQMGNIGFNWLRNGYNGKTLQVRAHLSWGILVGVTNECRSLLPGWPWQSTSKTFKVKLDP